MSQYNSILNKIIGIAVFLSTGVPLSAQEIKQPIPDSMRLDEVIISASNFTEKIKNIAQPVDLITSKTISRINAQNTGDLLMSTGKIFVQKSQQGGSSPVIRGFEASRILLIVDGVRMNNAIYRSGHLQNVITADQNMMSRVEILYGPSSAIYGSDALGGAIHFITKRPVLAYNGKTLHAGNAFVRYNNANQEKTIHADASIGGKKWGWLLSATYSDFGDMRMGNRYPENYPDFGRRSSYIGQINGSDSILSNPDDRIQKFSGYRQWDIMQKILFKPGNNTTHLLNFQLSNSSDVPRYDRLQDIRNGNLRWAVWKYGPQQRLLGSYEFNATPAGWFDEVKANISVQKIEESRITREYRQYDRLDSRGEQVTVGGAMLSGRKIMNRHELTAGLDLQFNDVRSTATRTNLLTGTVEKIDTRYPDGKNRMNSIALFAQHLHKFKNGKLVLNDGIRFQFIGLSSDIIDNSFFRLPDTAVRQNNAAITGNIGLVWNPDHKTTLRTNLSSGFRAPNIDDLSKIFETSTAARQVVIPNANLKPEYTYNFDLAIARKLGSRFTIELNGFYTLFRNAIVKAPFRLNGQDSILYNGVMCQVLASQNANRANLFGLTASARLEITAELLLESTISFTKGEFMVNPSSASAIYEKQPDGTYALVKRNVNRRPLDHIPPIFGRTSLRYSGTRMNSELFLQYNGWKRLERFNPDGEDNAQYATADGTPSWMTVNWNFGYKINSYLQIQGGVENIFDRNYRYFSSGFSAAGRSLFLTIRANW
jgi:hemoglobin/transferrin/lactoferrin receptor protein